MNQVRLHSADEARAYPSSVESARRRYLTILFSDLSGSTRLAGEMEAEDYALVLDRLRRAYEKIIPARGGTIVQISGDGFLAVFGYPHANETDGRDATLAALELHDCIRADDGTGAIPANLRLHAGIHAGLVLVHEGDSVRGRLELLGSATNIAWRLANAAQADEIIVSEVTLGPDRALFHTSERLYLSLKGKDKPIAAFRILGPATDAASDAADHRNRGGPFVGRRRELARIDQCVRRAEAGVVSNLIVAGPTGVGKTRLVDEFFRRVRPDVHVFRGECDYRPGAEPLQPILQILRSLLRFGYSDRASDGLERTLRELGPEVEKHIPTIVRLLRPGEGGGAEQNGLTTAAVTGALAAIFEVMGRTRVVALFIDDWQWADDACRQVLHSLRHLDGLPLTILLTLRSGSSEEDYAAGMDVLPLAPLDDEEASAIIRHALPKADPFAVDEIYKAAGGNPLFIEELCHSMADGHEDLSPHGGSAWLDILIESRFARLPDAETNLLKTAAVIGTTIPTWLLELTTGCTPEDDLLHTLAREDFIYPAERPGTLRFKHGITRDVIYDSVGLRERRALHLRMAEALRQNGSSSGEQELYEALAYHYGAGGDREATAHYAELAGDKALSASALDRAQAHYRAALAALDELAPSADISERWSGIAQRLGLANVFDPSRQHLPIFERAAAAAERSGDIGTTAWAEYWLGYIQYGLGESADAVGHLERALSAAIALKNEPLVVQIRATLGQAMAAACDYEHALPLLDQALAVKREHRKGSKPAVGSAYALACKGAILGDRGAFDEAETCFEEALAIVRGANHEVEGSILCWRSAVSLWRGRLDEARSFAAEAESIAGRVRTHYVFAQSRGLAGYADWLMTGDADALRRVADATSWQEARGLFLFTSLNHGWLTEALTALGRFKEARHYAARGLQRARKRDKLGTAMIYRALARAAVQGHGRLPVSFHLDRAEAVARDKSSAHEAAVNRLCAAEIAHSQGQWAKGLELLSEAEAAFLSMGMDWHLSRAAELRATF